MVLLLGAGPKGLEPSTSGLTGRRSNQLNYDPYNFFKLFLSLTSNESGIRTIYPINNSIGAKVRLWKLLTEPNDITKYPNKIKNNPEKNKI